MNNFFVTGRLGAHPELKYTPNGTAVLELSIADSYKSGEAWLTNWWKVTLWKEEAVKWSTQLKKGNEVALMGHLIQRKWTDKEGKERIAYEINFVEWFRFCWKPEKEHSDGGAGQSQPGPSM